jgi:hypothetical protein
MVSYKLQECSGKVSYAMRKHPGRDSMKKNVVIRMLSLAVCVAVIASFSGCAKSGETTGNSSVSQSESTESGGDSTDSAQDSGYAGSGSPEAESGVISAPEKTDAQSDDSGELDLTGLPHIPKEEYPLVDGSTACLPLIIKLYQLTTGASYEEAENYCKVSKTDYAYYALVEPKETCAHLVLAYEPSKDIYSYLDSSGVPYTMTAVGKDALVFLRNHSNPVGSVTEEQLVDIYQGKITKWAELGGDNLPIVAFQRSQGSGSQTLMEKLVMKGQEMMEAPSRLAPAEMGELIELVSSYNNEANAIGYSVYFYARNMYNKPEIDFLRVNGILPSNASIQKGSYPYVNDFYATIRQDEPEDSYASQLYRWLLTKQGQKLLASLGYVPVDGEIAAAEGGSSKDWTVEAGSSLPDIGDKILVLDGDQSFGSSGLHVFDSQMREISVIENVGMTDTFRVLDKDGMIGAIDLTTGLEGLFIPGQDRWMIDPDFDSVYETEPGIFEGYRQGEESRRFSWKNGVLSEPAEGLLFGLGDRVWKFDEDSRVMTVMDEDNREINRLDFNALGLSYGHHDGVSYIAEDEVGNSILFNKDGERIFDRTMIEDNLSAYTNGQNVCCFINFISSDGNLITVTLEDLEGDRNYLAEILYNVKEKKILSTPEEKVSAAHHAYEMDYSFSVAGEEGRRVYFMNTEPQLMQDGSNAEYYLGYGYFGRITENGDLYAENPEDKDSYTIEKPELIEDQLSYMELGKNLLVIFGDEESSVWQKGNCLARSKAVDFNMYQDYVSLRTDDVTYLFETLSGNQIYKGFECEYVYQIENGIVLSLGSNYKYLRTLDGGLIMKFLDRSVAED